MPEPQDDFPPHVSINAKLAEVVEISPQIPAWYDAWKLLGAQSSPEERLKVYQAVRDAGSLPEDAGFYLVAWQVDAITSDRGETELKEWEDRLDEMSRQDGENDGWDDETSSSSPEYENLLKEYYSAWDNLFARTLREFGENEIASLFESDPKQFEQRHEAGRQYFHGPLVPDWLDELVEAVAGCIEADDPLGPLGYRWHEESGFWEFDLYPMPVELVGGAVDGAVVDPGYSLDMTALQAVFDQAKFLYWNTHGYHGSDPPFVSVEGVYEGREMFVRILAAAPEGEEPGMKFQVTRS